MTNKLEEAVAEALCLYRLKNAGWSDSSIEKLDIKEQATDDWYVGNARYAISAIEALGMEIAPKPTGWQPIETAQRDGTSCLFLIDGAVIQGCYSVDFGKWYFPLNFSKNFPGNPTHWMPLPEPPKGDGYETL